MSDIIESENNNISKKNEKHNIENEQNEEIKEIITENKQDIKNNNKIIISPIIGQLIAQQQKKLDQSFEKIELMQSELNKHYLAFESLTRAYINERKRKRNNDSDDDSDDNSDTDDGDDEDDNDEPNKKKRKLKNDDEEEKEDKNEEEGEDDEYVLEEVGTIQIIH